MASQFAIADFDGENLPDLATVEIGQIGASYARYWIAFRMSAGTQQMIGVTGPVGGLEIAIRDVNGDSNLDLVVTTKLLNRPVVILVNDGHGNFTLTDPAAYSAIVSHVGDTWKPPSTELKDSVAAVLGRACGDCTLDSRRSGAAVAPESPAAEVSCQHAFPLGISVLGRAPPAVVHYV